MSERQDIRVLLVEDEPDSLEVARTLLAMNGIKHCFSFDRGQPALEFIEQEKKQAEPIQLALLDINLPDMDGYQLLEAIRENPNLAETQVIAITASIMPEQLSDVDDAGFDGLLGKPLDIERFPEQFERILARERVWEAL